MAERKHPADDYWVIRYAAYQMLDHRARVGDRYGYDSSDPESEFAKENAKALRCFNLLLQFDDEGKRRMPTPEEVREALQLLREANEWQPPSGPSRPL